MKLRHKLIVLSITSTAALAASVVVSSRIISVFREITKSQNYGINDLPLSANIVFSTYIFWWIFPLATFSLGLYIVRNESFSVVYQSVLLKVFLGGFVLALLLWLLTHGSMYDAITFMADKHEEQSNVSQQSNSAKKTSVEAPLTHEIELDERQVIFGSIVVRMAHTVNLLSDSECKKHAPMVKDIGMLIERMVNKFDISNGEELQNALSDPHIRKMAESNIRIGIESLDRDSLRRAGGRDESCQRLVKYFESEYKELYSKWINSIDPNLH